MMILSLGTSVRVSPFLSWLAEDCFLQFIREGLEKIILICLCMSKKEMVALFLFGCLCSVAQSCSTLCDPMDCRTPGFPVHGDSPGKNTGVGCCALL